MEKEKNMHYTQNTIRNSKIKENEWAISNRLNFAAFTSCIGIVGYDQKSNGALWGIHLVQAAEDFFNENDAQTVAGLVENYCEKENIKIFGCLSAWKSNPAYDKLKSSLVDKGFKVEEVNTPKDDGVYTVTYNTITSQIDIVKS
ncbi:MAG: hypothetical protein F6K14_17505 [Symploca sp. SIO2C1]|nr:hypothetical protein [Symploca sp. SIO2C1]